MASFRLGLALISSLGRLKPFPNTLEVIAAPGFFLQLQDHRGLEVAQRFEAAELHLASGCMGERSGLAYAWYF